MKTKFKNQSGITLIALIITIIILVILAAVSIRAITNMGIVGHAINGTQDYANASNNENQILGDTGNLIGDTVSRINEIQGRSNSSGGGETVESTGENEQNIELLNLLKDYVLGEVSEETGLRPGKNIFSIFDENTFTSFIDDPNTIEHASSEIVLLNAYQSDTEIVLYARYNNVAYRITAGKIDYVTTDLVEVYTPDANSRVGRIVKFKAKVSDETAGDWLVLYDNGTTVDIMSLAEMGSITLGPGDTQARTTLEAIEAEKVEGTDTLAREVTDLEVAQYSYENVVSRLNTYCESFVTNIDASNGEKVRSVGTQFDITDTTERYSSTFLLNNPNTAAKGTYNGVGLRGDMNGEQDLVRMSYYSVGGTGNEYTQFGYAVTTNPYWFASRYVSEFPDDYVCFSVHGVGGGFAINFGCDLWGVTADEVWLSNATGAVRPVARVSASKVSWL